MPVYKDKDGNWFVSVYFKNWEGKLDRKVKRGFSKRKDAVEWEAEFLNKKTEDPEMTFASFVELYERDLKQKLRTSTWIMKKSVIDQKIRPYFKAKKLKEIKPTDVIMWQNAMLSYRDREGKPYASTYLKTIHNQLSAIFNHAVKYYELRSNPAAKVGNMGKEKTKEMMYWTKPEYLQFAEAMMDKPLSYYAFEMLYWCGLRLGEMLALTPSDFDFEHGTVHITKSYQRISEQDIITDPKTPKSRRVVQMPQFLVDEMRDFIGSIYDIDPHERLFPVTKSYMHHEMNRGCKVSGVKRIRIHDLRHSHVSLLIEMGFSAVAIADRVGHESIDITYRYAHLFPTTQKEIAHKLDMERI